MTREPCTCYGTGPRCTSCYTYALVHEMEALEREQAQMTYELCLAQTREGAPRQQYHALRATCLCGKEFMLSSKQRINVRAGGRAYCSKECYGANAHKHQSLCARLADSTTPAAPYQGRTQLHAESAPGAGV